MKTYLMIVTLIFTALSAQAQKEPRLFRILEALPDTAVFGSLPLETRQKLIDRHKKGVNDPNLPPYLYLETVDHGNGYLKMGGAIEGSWDMCYWKISENSFLVVTNTFVCSTLCDWGELQFYYYDDEKITAAPIDKVIPDYANLADYFIKPQHKQFLLMESDDYHPFVEFEIPRRGKDIKVKFISNDGQDDFWYEAIYGTEMTLHWQKAQGVFLAGEID
ncbi:MAG: hypothetical protein AAF740_09505 [Bacteroidota bacterium]